MSSQVHRLRREMRAALSGARAIVGTFVKLPTVDVVELCQHAGADFVVIDLEHSALSEQDALALVRHADVCGLAALVRVPQVDPPLINRMLENGAAGIQLSMLRSAAQARALRDAVAYPPAGRRSVSATHRVAGMGGLADSLARESAQAPVLVGQVENADVEPLPGLLEGFDVCFVGSTDLSVDLGVRMGDAALVAAVETVREGAGKANVAFGGWTPTRAAAAGLGLDAAGYLVVGSDLQILAAGLRSVISPTEQESH